MKNEICKDPVLKSIDRSPSEIFLITGCEADELAFAASTGSRFMKRGKTEAETLKLNGWGVGSILEGDEGYGPDRIIITAIGQERFLCRWRSRMTGEWENGESGCTTLSCREWHLIENAEHTDTSR